MDKPAIEGGRPVRNEFLTFGKPRIFGDEIREVNLVLRSGWIGTGPKVNQLEKQFGKYIGNPHVLAINSATAGLYLALELFGVGEGDEVIIPSITFSATANVVVHKNATPIFADINPVTWNIDPEDIEKKVTKRTKAIIPVHLHGRPCNMKAISKIARKYKLFVVEDAAHATETKYQGSKIGTISDATVFSFYATKNLTTAEGGMIAFNNKKYLEPAKKLSLHGLSADAWKRYTSAGFQLYDTKSAGYKFNLTDIHAAIGVHQLKRIKKNLLIRKQYWKVYNQAFKHNPALSLPAPIDRGDTHAMHIYAMLLNLKKLSLNRQQFLYALQAENIGAGVHFTALHLHSYYRKQYGYRKGDLPVSEKLSEQLFSIPLYPHMTRKDVADVIRALNKLTDYYQNSTRQKLITS